MSNEQITVPPPHNEIDNRMVQLALSSMATTLESIQDSLKALPRVTETAIEARGAAVLAGNMAAQALEKLETVSQQMDRIERAVGKLAISVQGLEQASRSLMESVYPTEPPELAEVVPLRRNANTGE